MKQLKIIESKGNKERLEFQDADLKIAVKLTKFCGR